MKSPPLHALLIALISINIATGAEKPNIILIMPDDMGWGDIGAHGHPFIKTPHLDKLHAQSLRFTDFHVSPTCSPTRSALMTGRHEFKNGVTHTILERERLTLKATTLPQLLQKAGYGTGIFGKWHLGDEEAYQPDKRGFDEIFIHGAGGIGQTYPGSCGDFPNNKYFDPAILHNKTIVKTKGYCTDVFFKKSLDWIDEMRKTDKPFFAYITPNAPHGPEVSPGAQYEKTYRDQNCSPKDIAYFSMISNIDENIGALMDKLKQWNIEDNTLLIFLSDNGGTHTDAYSGGYRAGKGTPYQGGTHSPSFWRWPRVIHATVDCQALSAHIDILPTLAEIANIKLNESATAQVEGKSLLQLLMNPQSSWPERTLVTHLGRWPKGQHETSKYKNCAIRRGNYRLVNNRALYDVANDRSESKDIAAEHPEIVSQLRESYDNWWQETVPLLVNENAVGPAENPLKLLYRKQFGQVSK
jgi:arylsulfatase